MFRTALATAAVAGAVLIMPAPAQATFLPGTAPEDEWRCGAAVVRLDTSGVCGEPQHKEAASRIDLLGGAVVTSRGVAVGYTGDAHSGVATASASEVTVVGVGVNVRAFGLRVTESGHCGEPGHASSFSGTVHIDRLVVNGRTFTDLDGYREIPVGTGTVVVGSSQRKYYENSFDTLEGEWRSALTINVGTTRLGVGGANVHTLGFCNV